MNNGCEGHARNSCPAANVIVTKVGRDSLELVAPPFKTTVPLAPHFRLTVPEREGDPSNLWHHISDLLYLREKGIPRTSDITFQTYCT
jgi:hypothetical protein